MANNKQRVRIGCKVELTCGRFRGMTGVLVGYSPGLNGLVQLDGVRPGVLLMIDAASLQFAPEVSDNRIRPATEKTPPQPADRDFTAG